VFCTYAASDPDVDELTEPEAEVDGLPDTDVEAEAETVREGLPLMDELGVCDLLPDRE
jgi:hypothetical protein